MQTKKGHYVVKTVPLTTNNLTTGIINFLNSEGHKAFRVNTEGQFDPLTKGDWMWDKISNIITTLTSMKLVVGRWRKSNTEAGTSDIICCLNPTGQFFSVEVKVGKDTLKKHQMEWLSDIQSKGGLILIGHTLAQFMEAYEIYIKPTLTK